MKWQLLDDDTAREIWDETLVKFSDCNVYQSYTWGE